MPDELAERIGETITGADAIHANDTTQYELADFSSRLGRIYAIRFEIYKRKFAIKGLNNFLSLLTPFFFYSIGGYLVIEGSLTLGALLAVLAAYFAITLAYSLVLKRKMMIDVVTLAVLYAIRIIGGGVAIAVPISEWLLAFSLFIFTSLALIKRHSELGLRLQAGLGDPTNRNYRLDDLPVIAALAAASGYCAVIIFALYLSSDTVRSLYRHPEMLWLACPLLVYWISRVLLLSHRRLLIDDPVVFAMKDKVSIAVGALMVVVGYLAM